MVTPGAVTVTQPRMSLFATTAPAVAMVRSPLTTVSAVPAGTPVLPASGSPHADGLTMQPVAEPPGTGPGAGGGDVTVGLGRGALALDDGAALPEGAGAGEPLGPAPGLVLGPGDTLGPGDPLVPALPRMALMMAVWSAMHCVA